MEQPWLDNPALIDSLPCERVSINSLLPGQSVRLAGENLTHTRALAELYDELPPILVHRDTGRIIDGAHRCHAARIHGLTEVTARFFEGSEEAAFLLAVRLNMTHGLPLTLADRRAVATRIVDSHPEWSDRTIASLSGLSAFTVGTIRKSSGVDSQQASTRIGRDGRIRPVDSAQRRRLARQLLSERPTASLREIAKEVGISPSTVQDVRQRSERGEDPALPSQRKGVGGDPSQRRRHNGRPARQAPLQSEAILAKLRRDPSLRFNEAGRALLALLSQQTEATGNCSRFVDGLPPHCAGLIADLAFAIANEWHSFGEQVEERSRSVG
jgi:ParB-like chromosome segregation protein Spo0J